MHPTPPSPRNPLIAPPSTLDETNQRRDRHERPELSRGCVEFVAPIEYYTRPPMPPSYFFVIDVSAQAVQSGMLATVCRTVRAALDALPGDERTKVGILTFDRTLHFYHLKPPSGQPQMLVVPELDDTFVPLPTDLLASLHDPFVACSVAAPRNWGSSPVRHCRFPVQGPREKMTYR